MKLGLYTIVREIGHGGMGVVFHAQDPSGRDVAVKLLKGRSESLTRFSREARLQDQLGETEGFGPLLDMGVSPHGPYLVMPLLSGGTLRDRIESQGAFPIADAVDLVRRLAHALGRAHARGIVHRDVKPDNVLFSARGEPLLADLGLAKHFRRDVDGGSQSFALSQPGQARGTFGYMAPEQLRDAASSGPPADVYALGAVLYEVVTGQAAFQAVTFVELMTKVAEGRVKHPRSLRKDCPTWLANAIAQSLAVNPERRYPDGEALAQALARPQRTPSPAMLAAVLAVTVLTVALAAWLVVQRETPVAAPAEVSGVTPELEPGWSRLPEVYQALGRVEHGPRLVSVWGFGRDVGPVLALALEEHGALALEGRALRQWGGPLPNGLVILTPPPGDRFQAAALRPERSRGLTSSDGKLLGWNLDESSPLVEIPLESGVSTVSLSADGSRGALGMGKTVFRFNVGLGVPAEAAALLPTHSDPVTHVVAGRVSTLSASRSAIVVHDARGVGNAFSPRAELVGLSSIGEAEDPLSFDVEGGLHLWRDQQPIVLAPPVPGVELGQGVALAHLPGRRLALGHLNGVRLLEPDGALGWRESDRVLLPAGGAKLASLALSADGAALAIGTSRGAVLTFELEPSVSPQGLPRWSPLTSAGATTRRSGEGIEALCAFPEGEIVSASSDGWVTVWDPEDGRPLHAFDVGTPLLGLERLGGRTLITQGGDAAYGCGT